MCGHADWVLSDGPGPLALKPEVGMKVLIFQTSDRLPPGSSSLRIAIGALAVHWHRSGEITACMWSFKLDRPGLNANLNDARDIRLALLQ